MKDENGNYYINVPRNGGVSFSVTVIKDQSESGRTHSDDSESHAVYVAPAAYNSSAIPLYTASGLPGVTSAAIAEQSPVAMAAFAAAMPAGYEKGFTFNLLTNGLAEKSSKTVR